MGAALAGGSTLARATVALLVGGLLLLAAVAGVLPTLAGGACADPSGAESPPTASAERGIPALYLTLYRQAGTAYRVPWTVLAAIGSIESDHGRSARTGRAVGRERVRLLRRPDAVQHQGRAALDLAGLPCRRGR